MQRSLGAPYISHSHLLDNSTEGGASSKLRSVSFYMFLCFAFCCFSLKLFRVRPVCKNSSCYVE